MALVKRSINTIPTLQKFLSGSGTYITPAGCKRIRVRMVGGGAGGAGSASHVWNGGYGSNGGDSTFGVNTAGGGKAPTNHTIGGLGGTATLNSGANGLSLSGGKGDAPGGYEQATNYYSEGGGGGCSIFGGGGGGSQSSAGSNGATNTGAGGSGGGYHAASGLGTGGAGGGAGGYIEATIINPESSYAYSVGTGGTAGTAGTNGTAGGAGGSGIIIVEEYYD